MNSGFTGVGSSFHLLAYSPGTQLQLAQGEQTTAYLQLEITVLVLWRTQDVPCFFLCAIQLFIILPAPGMLEISPLLISKVRRQKSFLQGRLPARGMPHCK